MALMLGLAGAAVPATAANAAPPADPNAGPRTKALLAYLNDLPNRAGNKVLSGQFAGYPNVQYITNNSFDMRLMTEVRNESGKWPAIIGTDYTGRLATESNCRRIHTGHNTDLINYARAGGIVTITAHYYRPDQHGAGTKQCGLRSGSDGGYDLNRVLPNGADRANWLKMLDQTAAGLAQLRDNGVPVIWRPLHEVDYTSFWWARQDPVKYKAVWRDMFSYLTNTKGLHNLIWAFTGDGTYYPGNSYVDLLGADIYGGGSPRSTYYNFALDNNKAFAWSEFGNTSSCVECSSGYDFRNLINRIRDNTPRTSYFLVWAETWRIGNPSHINQTAMMNDPWVVDRGEVSY